MARVLKFLGVLGVAGVLLAQMQAAVASTPRAYLTPEHTAVSASAILFAPQFALNGPTESNLVSCGNLSFGFTTPLDNTLVTLRALTFSECDLGTVSGAVVASGTWRIRWRAATKAVLVNGANHLTITLPGCTVTVSPQKVRKAELMYYESNGRLSFTQQVYWPATSTGSCSYSEVTLNAEVELSPVVAYNPAPTS